MKISLIDIAELLSKTVSVSNSFPFYVRQAMGDASNDVNAALTNEAIKSIVDRIEADRVEVGHTFQRLLGTTQNAFGEAQTDDDHRDFANRKYEEYRACEDLLAKLVELTKKQK